MIEAYAEDPMGNSGPLADDVRQRLISGLRKHPTTIILLAMQAEQPVGIAVCFLGFSTFAAQPLINIHDLYVAHPLRGQGIGKMLLAHVEQEANSRNCCKLTLEVQEDNVRARTAYLAYGFSEPVYAEQSRGSLFLSKNVP